MDEMDGARLVIIASGCVASLILGALAAGLIFAVLHLRSRVNSSRGWRSTPGTVTASGSRGYSDDSSNYYAPAITYAYEVAGQPYQSNRIAFGIGPVSGQATPEQAMAEYPVGKPITVFYNPRNPADAVLQRRDTSCMLYVITLIVFILAATVPFAMVLAGLAALPSS